MTKGEYRKIKLNLITKKARKQFDGKPFFNETKFINFEYHIIFRIFQLSSICNLMACI